MLKTQEYLWDIFQELKVGKRAKDFAVYIYKQTGERCFVRDFGL